MGFRGYPGWWGERGDKGSAGEEGDVGLRGKDGDGGMDGRQGETGKMGPKGERVNDVRFFSLLLTYSYFQNLFIQFNPLYLKHYSRSNIYI